MSKVPAPSFPRPLWLTTPGEVRVESVWLSGHCPPDEELGAGGSAKPSGVRPVESPQE